MTDISRFVPDNVTWLRAAVSAVPWVGGALDHLLFDKASAIRVRNLEAALAAMSEQVQSFDERNIDKAWFQSDEALATFKLLSDRVSFDSDKQRVETMGRVFGACGHTAHSKDQMKQSVVEHLARLSSTQMGLLAAISKITPIKKELSMGPLAQQVVTGIWFSDIVAALESGPRFWLGTMQLDEEIEVLESFNTLRRMQLMVPSEPSYAVTAIGKLAASYLETAGL